MSSAVRGNFPRMFLSKDKNKCQEECKTWHWWTILATFKNLIWLFLSQDKWNKNEIPNKKDVKMKKKTKGK